MSDKPQELWGIVEVMGHARYAGRISEYTALGVPLVRVEIPANAEDQVPAHERLLGASSIFRITPTTEAVARSVARQCADRPLSVWDFPADLRARLEHHTGGDSHPLQDDDGDLDDEE